MKLFSVKPIWKNSLVLLRIWCGILFIYYGKSFLHFDKVQSFAEWLKEMNIPFPLLSAYLSKGVEFIGGFFSHHWLFDKTCLFIACN